MTHWAEAHIGMPWVAGHSDCWSFARRVWRERFGIEVPALGVDPGDLRGVRRAFHEGVEGGDWQMVEVPTEGDAVLMGRSSRPCHVGIWVSPDPDEAGVLHSVEGSGVIFTTPARLGPLGWRILGFYRRRA